MSKEIPAAMAKPVRNVSVIRQMNADPRDILKSRHVGEANSYINAVTNRRELKSRNTRHIVLTV